LAGSFLGLFRVQHIQVISYDPASLERYNNADNTQMLEAFFDQNMTTSEDGEFAKVNSRDEAAAIAGFTPRLPAGSEVTSLGVGAGQTVEINIDSAMMNAGLESFGYTDVKIPADLDGEKIVATIPRSISAAFGSCPESPDGSNDPDEIAGCIVLTQAPAPTVSAPDSFPVVQLGEVALQVLGMTPDEARQVSGSVDWATTLILPIPTGSDVQSHDVQVDGVMGTIILDQNDRYYAIVWVKDGILYGLTGQADSSPAFRLAETLE
jgi:hypothetical protein